MMSVLDVLLPPVLGGIIGYVTNDIAIRMLFRPHETKYLFGVRLPFTPGLIPKEKRRIAQSIGSAISENLMSQEVLKKNLLSEEISMKIRRSLASFFDKQKENDETVREFLLHVLSEDEVETVTGNIKSGLTRQVASAIGSANLGEQIADVVVQHVMKKLRVDGLYVVLPLSMLGSIWEQITDMIEKTAKKYLAKNIDELLKNNKEQIVGSLIADGVDALSGATMRQLFQGKEQPINQFVDACVGLYRTVILEYLPRILETINIPAMIEQRINEMDMKETEELILKVMNKELKSLVWLGALLGFIMGFINLLI